MVHILVPTSWLRAKHAPIHSLHSSCSGWGKKIRRMEWESPWETKIKIFKQYLSSSLSQTPNSLLSGTQRRTQNVPQRHCDSLILQLGRERQDVPWKPGDSSFAATPKRGYALRRKFVPKTSAWNLSAWGYHPIPPLLQWQLHVTDRSKSGRSKVEEKVFVYLRSLFSLSFSPTWV